MRRIDSLEPIAWLTANDPGDGEVAGYFVDLWPAEAWVLHAMFEHPDLPSGLTHADLRRIELDAEVADPIVVGGVNLDEVATATGASLGHRDRPPSAWRRLKWSELGRRLGHDPLAERPPPSHRSFPINTWPVSIFPPTEGSLDREQLDAVVDHLRDFTAGGLDAIVYCFYASVSLGSPGFSTALFEGRLGEVVGLLDQPDIKASPSNIWPEDREWLLTTDADLWGTRIAGRPELIDALKADARLEVAVMAVQWYPRPPSA